MTDTYADACIPRAALHNLSHPDNLGHLHVLRALRVFLSPAGCIRVRSMRTCLTHETFAICAGAASEQRTPSYGVAAASACFWGRVHAESPCCAFPAPQPKGLILRLFCIVFGTTPPFSLLEKYALCQRMGKCKH